MDPGSGPPRLSARWLAPAIAMAMASPMPKTSAPTKSRSPPDPARRGCLTPAVVDRDGDGIPDGEDACPDQKPGSLPDPARKGCPIPDKDSDGIPDADDQCQKNAQGAVADPTRRGCPLTTKTGTASTTTKTSARIAPPAACRIPVARAARSTIRITIWFPIARMPARKAGAPDRNPKRNGCPNPFVIIENGRVVLKQAIAFKLNSDEILPQSSLILTATANVLRDAAMVLKAAHRGAHR